LGEICWILYIVYWASFLVHFRIRETVVFTGTATAENVVFLTRMPLCLHFDARFSVPRNLKTRGSYAKMALNHLGPWPSLALGEGLCEVSSAAGRCWTWLVRHQPITFAIEAQGWDLSSAFLGVVMCCVTGPEDSDIVEVLFAEKAPTETEPRAIPSRSSAQRTVSGFEILI